MVIFYFLFLLCDILLRMSKTAAISPQQVAFILLVSVAKFATVRTMIALATKRNWKLHQLDINNVFLHGHLEEEVYLKIPNGYTGLHTQGQVNL